VRAPGGGVMYIFGDVNEDEITKYNAKVLK